MGVTVVVAAAWAVDVIVIVIVCRGRGVRMGVVVLVVVPMRMAVAVVVRVAVVVVVVVRMVVAMGMTVPMPRRIGPAFGFEGGLLVRHDQVHAREHFAQHVVGLDLEVIGLQLDGHVAVAEVVGGSGEIEGGAVLGAVAHDHHRLRRGLHADERAVFRHQHIAAAGLPLALKGKTK